MTKPHLHVSFCCSIRSILIEIWKLIFLASKGLKVPQILHIWITSSFMTSPFFILTLLSTMLQSYTIHFPSLLEFSFVLLMIGKNIIDSIIYNHGIHLRWLINIHISEWCTWKIWWKFNTKAMFLLKFAWAINSNVISKWISGQEAQIMGISLCPECIKGACKHTSVLEFIFLSASVF